MKKTNYGDRQVLEYNHILKLIGTFFYFINLASNVVHLAPICHSASLLLSPGASCCWPMETKAKISSYSISCLTPPLKPTATKHATRLGFRHFGRALRCITAGFGHFLSGGTVPNVVTLPAACRSGLVRRPIRGFKIEFCDCSGPSVASVTFLSSPLGSSSLLLLCFDIEWEIEQERQL